jgi:hypothetical protein
MSFSSSGLRSFWKPILTDVHFWVPVLVLLGGLAVLRWIS